MNSENSSFLVPQPDQIHLNQIKRNSVHIVSECCSAVAHLAAAGMHVDGFSCGRGFL